jgi:O-antigen ligase
VTATDAAGQPVRPNGLVRRLAPVEVALATPSIALIGLWIVWAEHDGGYDADTWYWGALVVLGLLTATVIVRRGRIQLTRLCVIALSLFAADTAWSYLSMAWAASPGIALEGSNRELLYLLVFCLVLVLPWTTRAATMAIAAWTGGVGGLAVLLILRLASADHLAPLFLDGRLIAPMGYSNATAALFTMGCLTSVGLGTQRILPGPARGLLLALGCADLQLAVIVQSRGWLFTLPIVALVSVLVLRDRLRLLAFAIPGLLGTGIILQRLLAVYSASAPGLDRAAQRAGEAGLLVCFAVLVAGTLLAWGDWLVRDRPLSHARRRQVGGIVAAVALAGCVGGGVAISHGHPVRFILREWHGFSHQPTSVTTGSRFLEVGSGRLDIWRVAIDAFAAHPIGGLGQDNFSDYYTARGRSGEEPNWVHSLELRLLAHTGLIGFVLFAAFLIAAVRAALVARGAGPREGGLAAVALLPLIVWVVHGSIDWFWEFPALSAPALGLLALAAGLQRGSPAPTSTPGRPGPGVAAEVPAPARPRRGPIAAWVAGAAGLLAATIVLGLPYLATRELSVASDISPRDPAQALADLRLAARLDPLNPDVPRMAGSIALLAGRDRLAAQEFTAELARRPANWFAHFGRGLALSALGRRQAARADYAAAVRIDRYASIAQVALAEIGSPSPLTTATARSVLLSLR